MSVSLTYRVVVYDYEIKAFVIVSEKVCEFNQIFMVQLKNSVH